MARRRNPVARWRCSASSTWTPETPCPGRARRRRRVPGACAGPTRRRRSRNGSTLTIRSSCTSSQVGHDGATYWRARLAWLGRASRPWGRPCVPEVYSSCARVSSASDSGQHPLPSATGSPPPASSTMAQGRGMPVPFHCASICSISRCPLSCSTKRASRVAARAGNARERLCIQRRGDTAGQPDAVQRDRGFDPVGQTPARRAHRAAGQPGAGGVRSRRPCCQKVAVVDVTFAIDHAMRLGAVRAIRATGWSRRSMAWAAAGSAGQLARDERVDGLDGIEIGGCHFLGRDLQLEFILQEEHQLMDARWNR